MHASDILYGVNPKKILACKWHSKTCCLSEQWTYQRLKMLKIVDSNNYALDINCKWEELYDTVFKTNRKQKIFIFSFIERNDFEPIKYKYYM